MRLLITKNQSKGMLGGVNFEVRAQVQLNPQEQQLVDYYRLHNEVLLSKPRVDIWKRPTGANVDINLTQLLQGTTFKCKGLAEVIEYSDHAKEACVTLKNYLAVASTFGGQEVIDF